MREPLVYAVGVAVSPVPIASALLVLTTARATANGVSFLAGWVLGVLFVTALLVALVQQAGLSDSDPLWIAVPELAVGLAFVAGAGLLWMRRRAAEPSRAWLTAVDRISTTRAAGLGALLSAANPKVIALALGAALSLAEADADISLASRTVVAFTAVGALGIALPLVAYVVLPGRASRLLAGVREWLEENESHVLVVLGLVLGVVFLRDGVASL